nr:helix-turn-helix transcriptional regulator [Pseudoalteromonas luteoviolacea]
MQSPPSIVELAKIVGVNDYKLKQQFKMVFSRAPFAYLTELRLNRAASLLARTELSVMQVAQEVGYKHAGHFAKNFKLKFGRTPKAYKTWISSNNT